MCTSLNKYGTRAIYDEWLFNCSHDYKIDSKKETFPKAGKHLVTLHTRKYEFLEITRTMLSIFVIYMMNYAK
jgi:hypothetical protein